MLLLILANNGFINLGELLFFLILANNGFINPGH